MSPSSRVVPQRVKQYIAPKRLYSGTRLHGITVQETTMGKI